MLEIQSRRWEPLPTSCSIVSFPSPLKRFVVNCFDSSFVSNFLQICCVVLIGLAHFIGIQNNCAPIRLSYWKFKIPCETVFIHFIQSHNFLTTVPLHCVLVKCLFTVSIQCVFLMFLSTVPAYHACLLSLHSAC